MNETVESQNPEAVGSLYIENWQRVFILHKDTRELIIEFMQCSSCGHLEFVRAMRSVPDKCPDCNVPTNKPVLAKAKREYIIDQIEELRKDMEDD